MNIQILNFKTNIVYKSKWVFGKVLDYNSRSIMSKFLFTFLITMLSYFNAISQEDTNWYPYQDSIGKWSFRSVDGEHLNGVYFDTIHNFIYGRASVNPTCKY